MRILVDEISPNSTTSQIAVIHSGIIVQSPISLAGTITGTFRLDYYNPIIAETYHFTGSGTAGDMGAVTLSGTISIPGLASTTDKATGRITLTNSSGSVTLQLTGPTESPLGPIPTTVSFKIISSTGAFFDDIATGAISITAAPPVGAMPEPFTFVIS